MLNTRIYAIYLYSEKQDNRCNFLLLPKVQLWCIQNAHKQLDVGQRSMFLFTFIGPAYYTTILPDCYSCIGNYYYISNYNNALPASCFLFLLLLLLLYYHLQHLGQLTCSDLLLLTQGRTLENIQYYQVITLEIVYEYVPAYQLGQQHTVFIPW